MQSDEYLIDYLLTTSMPATQIEEVGVQGALALGLAHDLCVDFGNLQPRYLELEDYYSGEPPLPREPERLTVEYRSLLLMARSNWCQLVVDVVNERLKIGSVGSTTNPNQDPVAWKWWQRNNMDGVSPQIHTAALKFGVCYVSVWPTIGGINDGSPRIMGESPLSAYVRFDPESGAPVAAIRLWMGCCDDRIYADVTLPDFQFRLVSNAKTTPQVQTQLRGGLIPRHMITINPSTVEWTFRDPMDAAPVVVNAMGVVPYVAMYTMPDLVGGYRSEIESILPIQDRINKTNFDRLVTQEFAAFPQRAIAGIDEFRDPVTGEVKLPFDAAVDRVWTATNPDTKFTQFEASNGAAYLDAVTADIQHLASQSRTPPHYLIAGMGVYPSGESLRATEFGLTRKIQIRQQSFGDAWSDVLRLCGRAAKNVDLTQDLGLSVVWDDVEARSEGEVVDALLKMGTLGVPWEALWQKWGATPEQVKDWTTKLDATLKRSTLFAQATTAPSTTQIQTQLPATAANADTNPITPV